MALHTHYDNLKVSRDAPPEVIRAAYKSLSQKYHPDRNPDPGAEGIMRLLNAAFEVLSDPVKRQQHDEWIRYQEQEGRDDNPQTKQTPQPDQRNRGDKPSFWREIGSIAKAPVAILLYLLSRIRAIGAIGVTAWIVYEMVVSPKAPPKLPTATHDDGLASHFSVSPPVDLTTKPQLVAAKAPVSRACVPMATDPAGNAWPTKPGYVTQVKNTNGYSTLTIDNSKGGSDIYLKLAKPGQGSVPGVREAYVPAGLSFKMNKIEPGSYVVKYKDVKSGCNSVSDRFDITERRTYDGVEYTEMSLTIYTLRNGNMHFKQLPQAEF